MNLYRDIRDILCKGYDKGEASAIAFLLLEEVAGIDRTQALMGQWTMDNGQRTTDEEELKEMAERIAAGEPVQYVIGKTDFCGLTFHVEPGVLIPRPETEELVGVVSSEFEGQRSEDEGLRFQVSGSRFHGPKVLDIGTGSGCIAISLAKTLEGAEVEAWDISDDALRIAKGNAEMNGVEVKFKKVDILNPNSAHALQAPLPQRGCRLGGLDIIVSNPPYICNKEAEEMSTNVLDHEPHIALFVPDEDPLLFYRKISELGLTLLKPKGRLYFEINRAYGPETVALLEGLGYKGVTLLKDQFNNDRMVYAIKP